MLFRSILAGPACLPLSLSPSFSPSIFLSFLPPLLWSHSPCLSPFHFFRLLSFSPSVSFSPSLFPFVSLPRSPSPPSFSLSISAFFTSSSFPSLLHSQDRFPVQSHQSPSHPQQLGRKVSRTFHLQSNIVPTNDSPSLSSFKPICHLIFSHSLGLSFSLSLLLTLSLSSCEHNIINLPLFCVCVCVYVCV